MTPLIWTLIALLAALLLIRLLVEFKTSRKDGSLVNVHPYRRMMPIIMPTKTESIVYFDHWLPTAALEQYIAQHGERLGCTRTHLFVAATAVGLHAHPNMNRFIAGQRLYQREGVWLSFSMKRQKLDAKAKIATVKLELPGEMTLSELCQRVNDKIGVERKADDTYLDKELNLFFKLPHFVLQRAFRLMLWLDAHHLLPHSFILPDAMYTSAFVANLGSLGMEPGYHHLYEWGNCPLFLMIGKSGDRVVPDPATEGGVKVEHGLWIRFTYDERVEDGLSARHGMDAMIGALEDPERAFGAGERTLLQARQ